MNNRQFVCPKCLFSDVTVGPACEGRQEPVYIVAICNRCGFVGTYEDVVPCDHGNATHASLSTCKH